ncbi:hypothetical protein EYF80_030791 [Liparis tanakae]|uniref:Uncharacterized protein n=1 Tax=Liparis tanakae TaxID=230148 RepID=A0A4Z2GZB2_9TELE|nr:hypothetical protein EYF80_030791 [Liparis tanakae]
MSTPALSSSTILVVLLRLQRECYTGKVKGSSLRVNLFPQNIQLQTKGRSPECQRRCARRCDVFPYTFAQPAMWQMCCFFFPVLEPLRNRGLGSEGPDARIYDAERCAVRWPALLTSHLTLYSWGRYTPLGAASCPPDPTGPPRPPAGRGGWASVPRRRRLDWNPAIASGPAPALSAGLGLLAAADSVGSALPAPERSAIVSDPTVLPACCHGLDHLTITGLNRYLLQLDDGLSGRHLDALLLVLLEEALLEARARLGLLCTRR